MVGSTEFPLIWKEKATPAGRSISRLAPSMRRTSDSGSIGWPTPTSLAPARNGNNEAGNSCGLVAIRSHALAMTRAAPTLEGDYNRKGLSPSSGDGLATQAKATESASAWPTPTSRDGKDGSYTPNVPLNGLLGRMVWAMPCADDTGLRTKPYAQGGSVLSLQAGKTEATGPRTNGASAQTEKRGALNPEFVFWLMGFPAEWVYCALAAMQSFRKSRPKSSPR